MRRMMRDLAREAGVSDVVTHDQRPATGAMHRMSRHKW
jgi:hypothetical protein